MTSAPDLHLSFIIILCGGLQRERRREREREREMNKVQRERERRLKICPRGLREIVIERRYEKGRERA